ncbi:unnamed protein product, partial [Arabidopsis halleri]
QNKDWTRKSKQNTLRRDSLNLKHSSKPKEDVPKPHKTVTCPLLQHFEQLEKLPCSL